MNASTDLDGKSVLVTGANRGIGKAFVEAAAARGASRIVAAMRKPADAASLAHLAGAPIDVVALELDRPDSIDAALRQIGPVDLFISNAGRSIIEPLLEQGGDDIRNMFEVNLFGPHRLALGLADGLVQRRGGILYVLSMAALLPAVGAESYSASKAAAAMLAHGLRTALKGRGVRISLVYPGFVDTDLGKAFDVPRASPRQIADQAIDGWLAGDTSIFPDQFARMTRDLLHTRMAAVLSEPADAIRQLVADFMQHPDAGR